MKAGVALFITALWGADPAFAQEKRMTETKKLNALPSLLTYDNDLFHQRLIGIDQLPPAKDKLLPLDDYAEKQRATQVSNSFGRIRGACAEYDRSLVP
jgi:hypothetical protein